MVSVESLQRGIGASGWPKAAEQLTDALDQAVYAPDRFVARERFELGEGYLDRIYIWAARRQVKDLGASSGDGFADSRDLVSGQVVEDYDVPGPERWREDVFDISAESISSHRAPTALSSQ